MAATPMSIGGIKLAGAGVPDEIVLGGDQRLAVHELPGGGRVVDVMGAQTRAITWTGLFAGSDAVERAQHIDHLRRVGDIVSLSFEAYDMDVVIERFRYAYTSSGNRIPYEIRCQPLNEEVAVGSSTDSVVSGALSLALDILSGVGETNLQGAVTLVSGLVDAGSVRAYDVEDVPAMQAIQTALAPVTRQGISELDSGGAAGFPASVIAITSALHGSAALASSILATNVLGQASLALSQP